MKRTKIVIRKRTWMILKRKMVIVRMTLMAKLTQKKIKKKKLQIDLPEESALNREKEKRGILASPARKGRRIGGHQRGKGGKVKRERRKKAHQRRNMKKERKGIQA